MSNPKPPRRPAAFATRVEVWPARERIAVLGSCLRGAFPPEEDEDLMAMLGQLAARGRQPGNDGHA